MPPQVPKTDAPKPVNSPPPEIHKDESKDVAKSKSSSDTGAAKSQAESTKSGTPALQKREPEDPKAAAKAAHASKQHAANKRSHDNAQAQMIQKKLHKQIPAAKTLAEYTRPELASELIKAGVVRASVNASATPSPADASGLKKGEKYGDLPAEVQRIGSTKVSFQEKEELIQKIYDYRQQATNTDLKSSPIFQQERLRPPGTEIIKVGVVKIPRKIPFQEVNKLDPKENRMEGGLTNILGSYGYHKTTDPQKQIEILDTALHNWSVTNTVDRASIHMRKGVGFIPNKDWKTPPDTRMEDRAYDAKQEVANPALPYNYGKDYFGPRGNEPDIDMVQGQAVKNFTDVANAITASAGPVEKPPVAEPAPPKPSPKPTLLLATAPSRTTGQAKGGGPLDKTQPSAAYEPTVQKQNMAYEPPSDLGPRRPPQNTQTGNPPPPPQNVRDPGRTGPSEPNGRRKGYTLPEAMYKGPNPISQRGAGPPPEIPWLSQMRSGKALTAEQIYEIHNIDSSRITWTMNPLEHARQWDLAKTKFPNDTSPAPIAFTTGDGRVVANMERWERREVPLWGMETTKE
jgi:hypothetical protein